MHFSQDSYLFRYWSTCQQWTTHGIARLWRKDDYSYFLLHLSGMEDLQCVIFTDLPPKLRYHDRDSLFISGFEVMLLQAKKFPQVWTVCDVTQKMKVNTFLLYFIKKQKPMNKKIVKIWSQLMTINNNIQKESLVLNYNSIIHKLALHSC